MYWEEYDGQSIEGFTHVGVEGNMVPITNIEEQVAELRRINGAAIPVLIYREDKPE